MTSSPTFDTSNSARLSGLAQIVGNTPLLEIPFEFRGKQRLIYAKSEQLNLTGSIKDRVALHILKEAYRREQLRPAIRLRRPLAVTRGSRLRPLAVLSVTPSRSLCRTG